MKAYNYSKSHRYFEYFMIFSFIVYVLTLSSLYIYSSQWHNWLWHLPLAAFLGWVVVDFWSGMMHFIMDNFGNENTPFMWEFIRPFRDHHVDPKDLTRHDFIELNAHCFGLVALLGIPLNFMIYWLQFPGYQLVALSMLIGSFIGAFTNLIHMWAHNDDNPKWVTWLQNHGLILSSKHHEIHHKTLDRYYAISNGFIDEFFYKWQIFEKIFRLKKRPKIPNLILINEFNKSTPSLDSHPLAPVKGSSTLHELQN